MNKQKGEILTGIFIFIGLLILGGSILLSNSLKGNQESVDLGTQSLVTYSRTILPIATSTTDYSSDLGTSTRRWGHLFVDYATTTSIDVYDDLKIGRSATTTITEGTITTTDLTVTGTCTGCSGAASIDLQDAYNTSAADVKFLG